MRLFSKKSPLPDLEGKSPEELLMLVDSLADPKDKYAVLMKAETLEPDNLEVQRRLLLHGRWHERNPNKVDFSTIKSFLLNAFEHPEKHELSTQRAMARELFDDPRLQRCLELSQDKPAFLKAYLEDLSRDYMHIFVVGDNSHVPRVFGLSFKGGLQKYLALPARDIISNIFQSPYLNREEARVLAQAFYRAFYEYAHGQVSELDSRLGLELRALLK